MNASEEENSSALRDDSRAFGMAVALGALCQLIACAIAVDLVNYSALKQVDIFSDRVIVNCFVNNLIDYREDREHM